jgi:hypothetical protein
MPCLFVVYDDSLIGVKVIITVCQLPPPVKDTQDATSMLLNIDEQSGSLHTILVPLSDGPWSASGYRSTCQRGAVRWSRP